VVIYTGLKGIIRLRGEDQALINKKNIFFLVRIFLGIVFLISSYSKLKDPMGFAQAIENYKIFGAFLSRWGAIFIPALEFILAILLITGKWIRETFIATTVLFIIFDVMIFQAYLRGLDISCGCFGTSHSPIDIWKFLENGIFTILTITGLVYYLPDKLDSRLKILNK
jgi:putative oxidoreductase